jgi:hypothetical protein
LDTDYKHLSREERQQRDADQASLKRQTSLTGKPKNRSADMDLPFANNRYEKVFLTEGTNEGLPIADYE